MFAAMSPDMLVIAFHFSPLSFNQTCLPGRIYGGLTSASSAFYLTMSVNLNTNKHNNIAPTITTKIKESQISAILSK